MSFQKRVLLWSSGAYTTDSGFSVANSTDGGSAIHGGIGDSCERHGGENNGGAQARLCPATGKYQKMAGLKWMSDVRSYGLSWSGHSTDDDCGGGIPGKINTHDHIKGGPWTRMEHVHVLDCAGFDRCQLFWEGKVLGYEGLAIDDTVTVQNTNMVLADTVRIAAAGMPAIDSGDSMFSIPKIMRLNENDSLLQEGATSAASTDTTTDKSPGAGNPRPVPFMFGTDPAGPNWEPDTWVHGAGMLWTQYRGIYPGTDRWWMYDQVRPALGFETSFANQSSGTVLNQNGPAGMYQIGKIYTNALKAVKRYKFSKAGDSLQWSAWIGYPNHALLYTAQSAGLTGNNWSNQAVPQLSISGLARICLVVGAIGLPWTGGGVSAAHVFAPDWSQAAPHNDTYLTSTPVAPAVAPREHIRGRLWAVLISDGGGRTI